jgi:SAM-dependent methyltransferase
MLYHVPDMDRALTEANRVLRPGGFLLAATNSRDSMRGFVRLVQSAALALGYHLEIPESPVLIKFSLENGLSLVKATFTDTKVYECESELAFPSPQPALDYINSLSHTYEALLPESLTWDALLEEAGRQIASIVATRGEYVVAKTTGLFLATKGG